MRLAVQKAARKQRANCRDLWHHPITGIRTLATLRASAGSPIAKQRFIEYSRQANTSFSPSDRRDNFLMRLARETGLEPATSGVTGRNNVISDVLHKFLNVP